MIFADAGTPINALQWQLLGPAAQTMGVQMERITAGVSANTIGPAMDSVVAKQPEAVKEFYREGSLMARFFFVTDPDGYRIEVLERHGRYR